MQKLLIVVALLCLQQVTYSQLRLGIWGGPQVTSVKESNSIPDWQTNTKPGYSNRSGINLGFLVEVPVSRRLYFQPSFMYTAKGRKFFQRNDSAVSIFTDTISSAINTGINYIEIPLNLTYKIPISSKAKFLVSAGPYVGFFLSGKQKSETRIYSTNDFKSEEAHLEAGKGEGKIKTFDAGFNARAGFEIGNILFTGFFSQGLTSFYTAPYNGSFKHNVKGISVGFWLNKVKEPARPVQVVIPVIVTPPPPKIVPDTDGDGLNDEVDSCPDKPGAVEFNGCPIPDSDGDGLNDKDDKCPADPGPLENGGCPPPPPAPVMSDTVRRQVVEKLNFAARNIFFKANSDQLTDDSYDALDEINAVLASHPNITMKIEGHTDASGNAAANRILSVKRAASVKKYLTDKGIIESRLITEGFGSDKPLDTNKTVSGRANNRRVELKLVQ